MAPIAATRMTRTSSRRRCSRSYPGIRRAGGRYLCTEEVPDSASVFIVGGGKVQRVALFQNEGITFDSVPSVDDVAANWSQIDDLQRETRHLLARLIAGVVTSRA